jgi:hypothetical protein
MATPAEARPPDERHRRLQAFVTRLLADADREGFSADDIRATLDSHRKEGS